MSRGDGASHLGDSTPPGLAGGGDGVEAEVRVLTSSIGPCALHSAAARRVLVPFVATLRAQLAEVTRERDEALRWSEHDADDEWTEEIKAAHPTRGGSHSAYAIAMYMVGNRHSKGALVDLVQWLFTSRAAARRDLAAATLRAERAERVVEAVRKPVCAAGRTWCRACGALYGLCGSDCAIAAYDRETGGAK